MSLRHLLSLMVLLLGLSVASATTVDANTPIIFTDKAARVLEDPGGKLSADEALTRLAEFKPVAEAGSLNQHSRYWVISELQSHLDVDRELRIDAPQWDEVRNDLIGSSGQRQALRVTGSLWGTYAPLVDTNPFVRASSAELS